MVLLVAINAKYIHSNLAIYCLESYVKKDFGEHVKRAEYTINNQKQQILQGIYEQKPEVVAFSCYIWNIEYVLDVVENLKKVMPEVEIILGGPEVSYRSKEVMTSYPFVDIVMQGEGEKTFYEYLDLKINGNGCLSEIQGITYRKKEGEQEAAMLCENPPREIMSMDEVVFPYENIEDLKNRIIYYETSRGCPFSCSYCLSSIDKTVRLRSLDKVFYELQFFLDKKVPQVKFVDRTFNCNHKHAYAIWEYIGKHDNGITNFHFEISADLVREEDFLLFETFRPGLIQLEIGVQTTNPKTLEAIRRKTDLTKLKEAVARVHKKGNIHQHLDLIAGLPYEDLESFIKSFNDVYAMAPDQLQLGFLKVLSGSYMGETVEENGIVFDSKPPYEVLKTKWMSYEDIIFLSEIEEMVEVHYNSFQFSATVALLEKCFEHPFLLYEKLANYYKKNGLFRGGISRFDRYNILMQFIEEIIDFSIVSKEDFVDALTFDLYLRDCVKNPPAFVKSWSKEENQRFHEFYDREEVEHTYLPDYEGYRARQLSNMTHLRKFSIDLQELLKTGKIIHEKQYYLFDYKNRNSLNHSARVIKVSEV